MQEECIIWKREWYLFNPNSTWKQPFFNVYSTLKSNVGSTSISNSKSTLIQRRNTTLCACWALACPPTHDYRNGGYAWSEHIVTVFLACQITIKSNLQSKEKQPQTVTPPPPKTVVPKMWLSWNEVFRCRQTFVRPSVGRSKKRLSSTPNDHVTSQIEHGDDVMSTVDVLWVVALAFPDGGGVWLQCVC